MVNENLDLCGNEMKRYLSGALSEDEDEEEEKKRYHQAQLSETEMP